MIQFVQVSKQYPKTNEYALEDINFQIDDGEFVFLIGPSGSGKTSVMRMLIREELPTGGRIYFDDHDITRLSRGSVYKLRRLVGTVFQDYKLIPHKNVYENIAFAMEVAGQEKHLINNTVLEMLDVVGLSHKAMSFPNQLSGGEQQRVAIARAISNSPQILIADEPTGNLDPASAWDIVQILTKINAWGTTVVMSTHGTDIVNSLNKRVIQLEDGKVVRDDNKGQYELARTDFAAKMLGEETESKAKRSIINFDLRTDKIREKLKSRQAPVKQAEEEVESQSEEEIEEQVVAPPEHRRGGIFGIFHRERPQPQVYEEPEAIDAGEEQEEEEGEVEVQKTEDEAVDRRYMKNEEDQLEDLYGESKPAKKKPAKISKKKEIRISEDAAKMKISDLDIPETLLKKLKKVGFKKVSEVIEAGPDNLLSEKVITPLDVISLSQAISEFVDEDS